MGVMSILPAITCLDSTYLKLGRFLNSIISRISRKPEPYMAVKGHLPGFNKHG